MSITSRINEMSSHIEQAYDELQGLGADLTNVDKNLENISMVLDDIYDSLPSVSGEGTSLTLDDTRVGKIKSTLKGNTSQDGTPTPSSPIPVNVVSGDNEIVVCRKNLFTLQNISNSTILGIERTINNSILTLNGTSTGSGQVIDRQTTGIVLPSGTYNISVRRSSGTVTANSKAIAFYLRTPSSTEIKVVSIQYFATSTYYFTSSFTLTESTEIYVEIYCNGAGLVADNLTLQFQIERGTSDTNFEQYDGNTYNIDLPVENVLANPSSNGSATGVGNMTLTWNTSNDFHLSGSTTSTGNVLGGTVASDYTIKEGDYLHLCNDSVPSGTIQFVGLTPQSTQAFVATINSKNKVLDLTSYVGKTIHSVFFYCVSGASADMTMTPMIVNGMSKVLSFTPYGTTPIEMCKIGNYQDYFYKDSGKWYLHKEIGKVTYNGTEPFGYSDSGVSGIKMISKILNDMATGNYLNGFSNYFKNNMSGKNANTIRLGANDKSFYIYINESDFASVDAWKTWLTTHNTNIYYILATPTNTEITYQPLIEQLNILEKAMSKDGQTNISQVNNDLPFIISASALKEWQESASLNSTLSMVNPLSLGNTLNTQENNTQPIEVDNIEPLEEEENEES